MKVLPTKAASPKVKNFFKMPKKPVSITPKAQKRPKVNVIYKGATGMALFGRKVGKNLYKIK